jgi:hypothetical protein
MSFENRKSISKKLTNESTHIKCMNQLLFSTRTIKSGSKDARVHCVVLKVRAVPTLVDHHAVSVKQEKVQRVQSETLSCPVPVPQDPTACNIPTSFTRAFLPTPKGRRTYSGSSDPYQCQCSTHERQQETFAPELTWPVSSAVYRRTGTCSLERR